MKNPILFILLSFIASSIIAQSSSINWITTDGSQTDAFGTSITADDDYVYATGVFADTCYFDNTRLISNGSFDMYISKYNNDGNLLWIKQFGGNGYDRGINILCSNNRIYLTGFFSDTIFFDDIKLIAAGSSDLFLLELDLNGNVNQAMQFGSTGKAQGYALSVDSQYNLCLSGIFNDTIFLADTLFVSRGEYDIITIKLSNTGNIIWAKQAGGIGEEVVTSLAIDDYDNIYLTGSYENTATFADTSIASLGYQDIFMVKYNSSGDQLWLQSAGGIWGDRAKAISIDKSDRLFLTGGFDGTSYFGNDSLISNGYHDVFLAMYNLSGELQWIDHYGSIEHDRASGLVVDNEYIYVVCQFGDETVIKDTLIPALSSQLIQFTKSGEPLDFIQLGNYYNNRIAIDKTSAIYATGATSHSPALFGDTLISSSLYGQNIFTSRIDYKHTAIQELLTPETVFAYPNPAHHTVSVSFDRDAIVSLYNFNGQMIQQQFFNKESGILTLDVLKLQPGIYVLTLQTKNKLVSAKFIKE